VNKHFEQKREKIILVVNFKPLNTTLNPMIYPLLNKASLL
jgi:hypothetical protein